MQKHNEEEGVREAIKAGSQSKAAVNENSIQIVVPSPKGYLNSSCICEKDSKAKNPSLASKMRMKR